jgi:signal recognition particle subunit SRP54
VAIAHAAVDWAKKHFHDVLIVDTAGRLAIDQAMMDEIAALHAALSPAETLFVVDAMTGQDAVNTARAFAEVLPLTGVVLTKLDGDARGGAALSVRHITGKPIKFVGVSEKLDGLEVFHPERMASRILGMGDILALVEEAHRNVDVQEAEKLAKKLKSGNRFDLEDFKSQLQQMKKMGGLGGMLDKLPAQMQAAAQGADMNRAERDTRRMEGIINSMTMLERSKPELIKASRKRRIAAGAGVQIQEVNRLLKQFEQMQTVMKQIQKGGLAKMMRGLRNIPGMR